MDTSILSKNLLDLNGNEIPQEILENFYKIKEKIGSTPMGISLVDGIFYIIDSSGKIYDSF
jgi:hypothetical protein